MDNSASWGPEPWISSVTLAGMLGALAWRLLDHDPENRVVAAVLVVVCAIVTLVLVRIRVRLRAGADGISVTGPLHTTHIPWTRIHTIHTEQRGRFGRRGILLEIEVTPVDGVGTDVRGAPATGLGPEFGQGQVNALDDGADDDLLTFGRFDLGTDPARVGRELLRLRAAAG